MNNNIRKFGTLMLHGMPMPKPEKPFYRGDVIGYNGTDFEIGDTVEGKELTWLKVGNLWVCDRNILAGVSWDTLNAKGYVFGKEITIDGHRFKLRCLSGSDGSEDSYGAGCDNEWDRFMDEYNEDNDLTHYEDMYTICQETDCDYSDYRSVRGYNSARYCSNYGAASSHSYLAFRPALEDLNPDQESSEK